MKKSLDPRTKPFALLLFAYMVVGAMVLTANTVMDAMIRELNWSDSQGALMITCLSLGSVLLGVLSSAIMEKIGRQRAVIVYTALMVVGYGMIALIPTPSLYAAGFFIAGMSWGGLNTLLNIVVADMYDGSPAQLNMGHAAYALGAVSFPLLVSWVLANGLSWRIPIGTVAVLAAIMTAVACFVPMPAKKAKPESAVEQSKGRNSFWHESGFYLFFIAFFVYVGTEGAVSSWMSGFLSQENNFFKAIPAQTMVSVMWLMLFAGRMFFASVSGRIDRRKLLLGLNLGFLIGLTVLVIGAGTTWVAIAATAFMGFSMSATYATMVSNAQRYLEMSPVSCGIIMAAGGIGSSVIPFVAGLVSDGFGLKAGMFALCGFLVLMLLSNLLNRKKA